MTNRLDRYAQQMEEAGQKESGRRLFLLAGVAACLAPGPAAADALEPGGLSFRDFSANDNGASFYRGDPMMAGGPNPVSSKVLAIDKEQGFARIQFGSIRIDLSLPLGWMAHEDWERGVAFSSDKRFRLIIWRVDFPFEGVKDAEHYAATKTGSIQARRPNVKAQARKLGDGSFLMVYENVARAQGDAEPRVVFDWLKQNPNNSKEGVLLTLGAPASEAARGLKLLALIKQSINITW
jgi:hypothetical protein